MKQNYKVIARFIPFNSSEEYITIKSDGLDEEILTFSFNDKSISIDKDLQEGDLVKIDSSTTIRKI